MSATPQRPIARFALALIVVALSIALAGCAATRGRRGEPRESGFLGDYSELEKRDGYDAQAIYINPNAVWSRYDSISIDSVTLWAAKETSELKPEDRQMLTDVLYKALHEKIGEKFKIVDHPGPDALRLRAALTQAKGAMVPLRALTSVHPGSLVLGRLGALATDTAKTVGTATVEVELEDAITKERLAAAVDERAGTKVLFLLSPGRTFTKWGDVKAAADYWAERIRDFLVKQGVQQTS